MGVIYEDLCGRGLSVKYRPEIDGLRAIAVLSVVFFHTEISFFGIGKIWTGFFGVDVFFVISGYLITSILLREMKAGRFRFLDFWERRARRILPALFVVLIATTIFASLTLVPWRLERYAQSLIAGVFFSYNFWIIYWYGHHLHFLDHLWSLAIEEQFYILFPGVLFWGWLFYRKRIKHAVLLCCGLSLISMCLLIPLDVRTALYFLPTRMWELLAGSFLAVLELERGRARKKTLLTTLMPAVGLLMLLLSMQATHMDELIGLVGWSVVCVVGTMLVIWFGGHGDFATKLLSSKPFVAVGLISYSLYLWHVPLEVLGTWNSEAYGYPKSPYTQWGVVVASLVCSGFTWFCVERPFRNRQRISRRMLLISVLSCGGLLVGWGLWCVS